MESRRNGPQPSTRHNDDDDVNAGLELLLSGGVESSS